MHGSIGGRWPDVHPRRDGNTHPNGKPQGLSPPDLPAHEQPAAYLTAIARDPRRTSWFPEMSRAPNPEVPRCSVCCPARHRTPQGPDRRLSPVRVVPSLAPPTARNQPAYRGPRHLRSRPLGPGSDCPLELNVCDTDEPHTSSGISGSGQSLGDCGRAGGRGEHRNAGGNNQCSGPQRAQPRPDTNRASGEVPVQPVWNIPKSMTGGSSCGP